MKKILKGIIVFVFSIIIGLLIYNQICFPIIPNRRVVEALEFCKKHNLNTDYCILWISLNMQVRSVTLSIT